MSNVLLIKKEIFDRYELSEKIAVNNKKISISLLKDLLSNYQYYTTIEEIFSSEISKVEIRFIEKYLLIKSLTKLEILNGIKIAIETGKIVLTDIESDRLNNICNLISYNKFIERYKNDNITVEIDGNSITVKISDIINFLELSDEEYEDFFNLEKEPFINGIPKEHFSYVVFTFLLENKILSDYIIPKKISDRYNDLYQLRKIDIESINQMTSIMDNNIENVILNEALKQEVLKEMPDNINDLEKAIYIYIKLCKILIYDDEFYVFNQGGDIAEKHQDINNILNITPKNNRVVCYEINEIYAKFLEELGINFMSYPISQWNYGEGHAYLEFRYGKFLIEADSLKFILNSDLFNAKLNQPLMGLICKNKNETTQEEFKKIVSKIYKLIAKNDIVEHIETYEELLEQYNYNETSINLTAKIRILLGKLYSKNLTGLDSLAYSLQLLKTIFSEQERKENININIIKNNNTIDTTQDAMASAIITINQTDIIDNSSKNMYYLYIPGQRLKLMTKSELMEKFINDEFEYSEYKDPRIPGIIVDKDCCYDSKKNHQNMLKLY